MWFSALSDVEETRRHECMVRTPALAASPGSFGGGGFGGGGSC